MIKIPKLTKLKAAVTVVGSFVLGFGSKIATSMAVTTQSAMYMESLKEGSNQLAARTAGLPDIIGIVLMTLAVIGFISGAVAVALDIYKANKAD